MTAQQSKSHGPQEPFIVRFAAVIALFGFAAVIAVTVFGLPGQIHGLIFRTSSSPQESELTLKVVAGVGAFFIAVLALGRFELSRSERRQNENALDYSEQTLYEGQYTRAIAQLASTEDMVKLGGIYSLGLLYEHSPRHRTIVVRALSAFIRTYPPSPRKNVHGLPDTLNTAITIVREFEDLPIGLEVSDAALDWASMDGSKLCASDLGGASLKNATLTYTDLTWSSLRMTDLSGADLEGAVLDWCNLAGANLAGANLVGASFRNSDLSNVDFSGANTAGTDFTDSTWDLDVPPQWPTDFAPPARRGTIGFSELDRARAEYIERKGRTTEGMRFSAAALREHDARYRRKILSSREKPDRSNNSAAKSRPH